MPAVVDFEANSSYKRISWSSEHAGASGQRGHGFTDIEATSRGHRISRQKTLQCSKQWTSLIAPKCSTSSPLSSQKDRVEVRVDARYEPS